MWQWRWVNAMNSTSHADPGWHVQKGAACQQRTHRPLTLRYFHTCQDTLQRDIDQPSKPAMRISSVCYLFIGIAFTAKGALASYRPTCPRSESSKRNDGWRSHLLGAC